MHFFAVHIYHSKPYIYNLWLEWSFSWSFSCYRHKYVDDCWFNNFFLKGSIDWTDGLIARIKNQTSPVGHILDTWGSHIGNISLITSIGVYCFNLTNNSIYLFFTILILFLKIIDFKFFAYHQLFYEVLNKKINIKSYISEENENLKSIVF